jgi:hypothetical protein
MEILLVEKREMGLGKDELYILCDNIRMVGSLTPQHILGNMVPSKVTLQGRDVYAKLSARIGWIIPVQRETVIFISIFP